MNGQTILGLGGIQGFDVGTLQSYCMYIAIPHRPLLTLKQVVLVYTFIHRKIFLKRLFVNSPYSVAFN